MARRQYKTKLEALQRLPALISLSIIERDVQPEQERRICTTCDNAQLVNGWGAWVCCMDHDTGAVLAGEIMCGDYA